MFNNATMELLEMRYMISSSVSLHESSILWMDEILQHLETMGNQCLMILTGESNHSRV